MYHSITFKDLNNQNAKNTYSDWHLVPATRPVIDPPSPKTTYVDIPGGDGSIDLSELLTSGPVFNDREGDLEFYVLNGYSWIDIYTTILNYIHGRKLRMILEDDSTYYYEGRFEVDSWESPSDGTWSTIKLKYRLQPYKYLISNPSTKSL